MEINLTDGYELEEIRKIKTNEGIFFDMKFFDRISMREVKMYKVKIKQEVLDKLSE